MHFVSTGYSSLQRLKMRTCLGCCTRRQGACKFQLYSDQFNSKDVAHVVTEQAIHELDRCRMYYSRTSNCAQVHCSASVVAKTCMIMIHQLRWFINSTNVRTIATYDCSLLAHYLFIHY
jgi:hypothetical protein